VVQNLALNAYKVPVRASQPRDRSATTQHTHTANSGLGLCFHRHQLGLGWAGTHRAWAQRGEPGT